MPANPTRMYGKSRCNSSSGYPKARSSQSQVVMPDASVTEGFAEADCKKLKPDAIIQFERFGFVRVNEVGDKIIAYYAHK